MNKETCLDIFQKGFNYSNDGPGNRLIYHLQGCNMRCPWCANPEGMKISGGTKYSLSELLDEVISSKPMFFDGGGVTLSGGEPTIQFEEVKLFLEQLKRHEISTAIETNGTHRNLSLLFPYIDYLICDFKHPNDEKHKETTGVSNNIIKENISNAVLNGINTLVRTPLIHGFNDSEEDLNGFLDFAKNINSNNVSFEFLPYHEYGKVKWEKLGKIYDIINGYISAETINKFTDIFSQSNLKIIKT